MKEGSNHIQMYAAFNMVSLLILTLFSTAYANVYIDSKCPEVKSVESLQFSKHGDGIWYEIARYPNDAEEDTRCAYGIYTSKGDYSTIESFIMKNDQQFKLQGTMRPPVSNGGKVVSTLFYKNMKIENSVYVLDSDYDNYSIVYDCKYNEEKKSRQDFVWVVSRQSSPSPDVKAKIENFIKASEFLDYDKLIWPESNCAVLR